MTHNDMDTDSFGHAEHLKPSIKALWLKALRSGEYEQGAGALHNNSIDKDGSTRSEFCCLGVLCDLAMKSSELKIQVEQGQSGYVTYDDDEGGLPLSVQIWSGLKTANPIVETVMGKPSLAELNDKGKTFQEIADIIEHHL